MKTHSIVTVVGARPQFVKAAVLSRLIRSSEYEGRIREILVHTGQHYDPNMSDIFFKEMEIPEPDIHLGIGSGSHGKMTGEMLARIEEVLVEHKPDMVLVYGDTNSTLAGALAASKLHIPVAHVEAGLRSFDMRMPEEQNRIVADHLSSLLFCPTNTAVANLAKEGLTRGVYQVGDIMLDAALHYRRKVEERLASGGTFLPGLELPKDFYLLTLHRAENTDDPVRLGSIVAALNARPDLPGIFPVHPRTRKALDKAGLAFGPHIHRIEPVGYFAMLELEIRCSRIVTDSGGVQKEAYFFGKPCVTLRDQTEWTETVDAGWNTLTGANQDQILAAFDKPIISYGMTQNLYGDGQAAPEILQIIAT